jgi:murein L,D-transpeptidase YafK
VVSVLVFCLVFFSIISPGEAEVQADRILVEKSKRKMTLYQGEKTLKTYRIALGKNPAGHKVRKGNEKTPVGKYYIDYRNPDSRFHLSLHISYPNDRDIMRAMKRDVTPGRNVMIHGLKKEIEW